MSPPANRQSMTGTAVVKGPDELAAWEKRWPVLDPSKRSPFLERWDVTMFLLLIVVSGLAPFETALKKPKWDWLLFLNLCINCAFLFDMALQFMTAYPDPVHEGRMIKRPRKIIRHYAMGSFLLDLISAVPIDMFLVYINPDDGRQTGARGVDGFVFVRVLRLLRLVRLLRLTHLSALVHRWQASVGINYSSITMVRLCFYMGFCFHWTACIWAWVATQIGSTQGRTWITAVRNLKEGGPAAGPDQLYGNSQGYDFETGITGIYSLALYWAIMTTTTIGYGDINPQNIVEYTAGCVLMVCAALTWAVVLGEVCTILATLAPHDISFKRTMDDLNRLMEDQRMPAEMRRTLRTYFHYGKRVKRYMDQLVIVDQMSPMLQGKVSMHLHNPWLAKVWYLQGLPTDTVVAIARELAVVVLAHQEEVRFGPRKLYIVRRGVCVVGMRVKSSGETWGEDMVLHNAHLREQVLTRALSYMEVLTLEYNDLIGAIEGCAQSHESLQKIHWARACMALRRGMVKIALALKNWEYRTGMSAKRISKEALHTLIHQAVNGQDLDGNTIDLGPAPVGEEETEELEEGDEQNQGEWGTAGDDMRNDGSKDGRPTGSLVRASGRQTTTRGSQMSKLPPVSTMGRSSMRGSTRGTWHTVTSTSGAVGLDLSGTPMPAARTKRASVRTEYAGRHYGSGSCCNCESVLAKLLDGKLAQLKKHVEARLEEKLGTISC